MDLLKTIPKISAQVFALNVLDIVITLFVLSTGEAFEYCTLPLNVPVKIFDAAFFVVIFWALVRQIRRENRPTWTPAVFTLAVYMLSFYVLVTINNLWVLVHVL